MTRDLVEDMLLVSPCSSRRPLLLPQGAERIQGMVDYANYYHSPIYALKVLINDLKSQSIGTAGEASIDLSVLASSPAVRGNRFPDRGLFTK